MKNVIVIVLLLISTATFAQKIDTLHFTATTMDQLKAIENQLAELTPERVEARKQELQRMQNLLINTFLEARGKALKQGDSLKFLPPNVFRIQRATSKEKPKE